MRRCQGGHLSPADPQLPGLPTLSLCFPTWVIVGARASWGSEHSGEVQEVARFLTLKSAMWLPGKLLCLKQVCIYGRQALISQWTLAPCWKSPITSEGWVPC